MSFVGSAVTMDPTLTVRIGRGGVASARALKPTKPTMTPAVKTA